MKPNAAMSFLVFVVFLVISSAIYHAFAAGNCTYDTRIKHVPGGGIVVTTVRVCCDERGRCSETVIPNR
jgi:hypothetical protein